MHLSDRSLARGSPALIFALVRRDRRTTRNFSRDSRRSIARKSGRRKCSATSSPGIARNRRARPRRNARSWLAENVSDTTLKSLTEISGMLRAQLDQVTGQARRLTDNVDSRLKELREENTQQIEKMRATVDEKLQGTLEKRLGESFKLVSDRLEQVHQGLGAMRQLASDVGGLQKVLANVKMRGGWGEVQLGNLLEQVLTADQFARNVKIREESGENVDFAIRLPGDENGAPVWLPIDAKFPTEDYQRLLAAQDQGDVEMIEGAMKGLETALRKNAKDICSKYINPPQHHGFCADVPAHGRTLR